MDVLAVNDQENLAHKLHAAAAAKPLNAGLKGFSTKTPAHKTPFKVPLNDENAFKAGKSVLQTNGKGNENLLMTSKKGGKLDENAFVTPAGPRTRAPLGMKTTNAKAKGFQTPAPLSASAKTQKLSPRLRRPKVKVHQPEPQAEEEDDVPEPEYMPPREIPLPEDYDEDMPPINWDFPMFRGKNMTRGISEIYLNPVEADGRTRIEREEDEWLVKSGKERDEESDRLLKKIMAEDEASIDFGVEPITKTAPKESLLKKRTPALSTIKARSAAAALSPAPKPSYAAPTAAAKSKGLFAAKKTKPAIAPSATRHAAATAASRSTIGYAQGRPGASNARKPLSSITRPTSSSQRAIPSSSLPKRSASSNADPVRPRTGRTLSRTASTATDATLVADPQEGQSYRTAHDIEMEMRLMALGEDDEQDVDTWMDSFASQIAGDPLEDEYADFQFLLPAEL
ncbi:hypothetical protein EJ04DRAFT_507965 [Polyplosphaeria fusca]|uniref:Uncharacterized protein n=1 Tax=Polyplosphaeria fusca TaxID=682080 RepID=A0A9P4V8B9_9PLEO|nr:hypothetical protein EJ04DRAFT_507965 [Polyplosphaeria fusca]